MKIKTLSFALGLAAIAFGLATPARAALTYNSGDLLLGFYATGGQGASESLVINLGQASIYRDYAGSGFNLSLGNIGLDLTGVFGEDWATRSDVKWGVFGTTYNVAAGGDPVHTLYASRPEATFGTVGLAYNRGSANTQSQAAAKIFSVGVAYQSGTATANSSVATIQEASISNDFAQWQTLNGSQSFGYFSGALGSFNAGAENAALDLFRMETGSSSLKGTYEGTFTISAGGVIHFAAIPEPSVTGLLLGVIGAAAMVGIVRRRRGAVRCA